MHSVEADLQDMGYQVFAISADRPANLRESIDRHRVGFWLLSDSSMAAAMQFGLAWQAPESLVETYLSFGIDLEAASGASHHILPVPAVFIVGTDAVVRYRYANPNHRVRLDKETLLAEAEKWMKELSQ